MKNNTKLSRNRLVRLLAVGLLIVMMGMLLTSCRSGSTRITSLTQNKDYKVTVTDQNGLTAAELETLIEKIADSKEGFTVRNGLIAALNGYDMTAADFDDSRIHLPGETLENPLPQNPAMAPKYAHNVLVYYKVIDKAEYLVPVDQSASVASETDAASETDTTAETEPTTEGETEPAETPVDTGVRLTTADVQVLVDAFKTTVAVEEKLDVLSQVLHWIALGLEWLIQVPGFGSFLLGVFYFAIVLEILMLPLAIYQQKNSRKQAKLRPREMAIRNKYKGRNDQATTQKLNQEIQELYSKEGYSPLAGCLPLLLTMPFLIFLYYIVIDPMTYMLGASNELANMILTFADAPRAAGGLGMTLGTDRGSIEVLSLIRDLTVENLGVFESFQYITNGDACHEALLAMQERIPDFTLFGYNLGLNPQPFGKPYEFMLIPVLTFLVYWGGTKITRKFTFQPMQQENDPAQGCSNNMMNIMMPAMSAFFTFMVPAVVGIYWMFKSVLGTIKTIIIAKVMPLPVFSEEDYKAAERELAGKDKNKPVKRDPSKPKNPNVRSLHHIDDDDYADTPAPEQKKGAAKPDYVEPEEEIKPDVAENGYAAGATLKEDAPAREEKPLFSWMKKKSKNKPESTEQTDAPAADESDNGQD